MTSCFRPGSDAPLWYMIRNNWLCFLPAIFGKHHLQDSDMNQGYTFICCCFTAGMILINRQKKDLHVIYRFLSAWQRFLPRPAAEKRLQNAAGSRGAPSFRTILVSLPRLPFHLVPSLWNMKPLSVAPLFTRGHRSRWRRMFDFAGFCVGFLMQPQRKLRLVLGVKRC